MLTSIIQWSGGTSLSDYNPETIPVQWDMWLRHTRKHVPTIEELERDAERIRIVRHNAKVLAIRDAMERQKMLDQQEKEHAEATIQASQEANRTQVPSNGTPQPAPSPQPQPQPQPQKIRKPTKLNLEPLQF